MERVVIVGGGVMGSAVAWFLAHDHGIRATVLERDASYTWASSARSACAIRQQFSTAINIRVSQSSLAFYRAIGEALKVGDDRPSIGLVEPGYLYLSATAAGASLLREQHALQATHDVHTALLDAGALGDRFPWLHTDDVVLGSLGLSTATSGEGWFDGYAAMQAFRTAAVAAGAEFIEADVTGFASATDEGHVRSVTCADGRVFEADDVVIAAGAWSGHVTSLLGTPLPVFARKRDVFAFEADVSLPDAPLLIDPSGVWFRPEQERGRFLCGAPPRVDDNDVPLERVDHALFDEFIWPALAHRVPAFDALRVTASWAGYYEMNDFDHNGLVGRMPSFGNVYAACGFSGHGLQQAPAVGQGLAELIATGAYRSIDLAPFGIERIAKGQPLLERNVI
ncbi:MAG TPA: FAD-binding oxidoreductase [Gemmatimonas sp.]|uniref:NAD(P)/FAD-dependent oxidoreductase n=1 Tax=Gemmatimonas sp. TaxID=1962908 RepID=UPI002EDA8AD1